MSDGLVRMDLKGQPTNLPTKVPWPEEGWRPLSWRHGISRSDRFPDHHAAHRHELFHHLDDFGEECEHESRRRCRCRSGVWCCAAMTAEDLLCDDCRRWCRD